MRIRNTDSNHGRNNGNDGARKNDGALHFCGPFRSLRIVRQKIQSNILKSSEVFGVKIKDLWTFLNFKHEFTNFRLFDLFAAADDFDLENMISYTSWYQ